MSYWHHVIWITFFANAGWYGLTTYPRGGTLILWITSAFTGVFALMPAFFVWLIALLVSKLRGAEKPVLEKYIGIGGVVVCALLWLGVILQGDQSSATETTSTVRVMVSSQDAEGLTHEQMDQTFLDNYETYTRLRVAELSQEALATRGYDNDYGDLESGALFVESDGKKLAVVRLRFRDLTNTLVVAGIVNGQFTRVSCVGEKRIPVSYGPCGDRVEEVFSVNLSVDDQ